MGQSQEQNVKAETIIRCCLSGKPKLKQQHPIRVQVQLGHVRKPRTHVQVSEARTQTPAVWMGPVRTGRPSSVPFLWLLQIDRDHLLLDTPGSAQVIQMARLSVSAQT